MSENITPGRLLRRWRSFNELRQEDVAEAAGLTVSRVSGLERDLYMMGLDEAVALCRCVEGLTLEDLAAAVGVVVGGGE